MIYQWVKAFFVTTISLLLMSYMFGCATLNESECKSANWEIIGLEDGSKGRDSSYIGEHRKACSEYTISPDLEAYLKGHAAGLRNYCTEQTGYSLGERGKALSQVCSGPLAANFARGYHLGYRVFQARAEVQAVRSKIDSLYHRLDEIERIRRNYEDELVRNETPEYRRRELLDEIKLLERESESILIEIDHLKPELERLERNYQRIIGN